MQVVSQVHPTTTIKSNFRHGEQKVAQHKNTYHGGVRQVAGQLGLRPDNGRLKSRQLAGIKRTKKGGEKVEKKPTPFSKRSSLRVLITKDGHVIIDITAKVVVPRTKAGRKCGTKF